MSPVPLPPVDSSAFLFDFSCQKSVCRDSSLGYHTTPQRCIMPTPVFPDERALCDESHGPADSTSAPGDPDVPGLSRAELERRSARPYSVRVNDPEDFAHVWERTIVPLVIEILQANCDCDFSIDVHNFPEISSESVPRIIYITLPIVASVALQELVRNELARKMPARFHQTHLKFRQGTVTKTGVPETTQDVDDPQAKTTETWWGTDVNNLDHVCVAKNAGFHQVPRMGMSIGPHCSKADAGSVGGYVKVGGDLYGVSCRHVFDKAIDDGDTRVVHPAQGDHHANLTTEPRSRQSTMGNLFLWSRKDPTSKRDVTRVSLTFDRSGVSADLNRVAMDWCLFGPVPEGKNFLAVPSVDMNRVVAIENSAVIEGNTEVHTIARTSGYSLGYTSDVPGVRMLERTFRREWTVRQYSSSTFDKSTHLKPSWQCIKRWVTSGMGVPGDSGAWLMRRSDNAVIGLIWARNHDHGDPVERVRLTYITPIVDVLADIEERVQGEVLFPSYSGPDVSYDPIACEVPAGLGVGHSAEPWNQLSMQDLRERRKEEESVIESGAFDDVKVPSLSPHPLRFHEPTAEQQGDRAHDSVTFASDSSMSVQASPDMTEFSESVNPAFGRVMSMGLASVLQPGPGGSTPPDLVTDLSANSSVSSDLGELDCSMSSVSVVIAEHDGSSEVQYINRGEDPVRSKARFAPVGVESELWVGGK